MRAISATAALMLIGCLPGLARAQNVNMRPLPPVSSTASREAQLVVHHDPIEEYRVASTFGSSFMTHPPEPQAAPVPAPNNVAPANNTYFSDTMHCWDDYAAECDPCRPCHCSPWFGSIGGVIMGRNRPNGYWTTFDAPNINNALMNTQHAGANWGGGGEINIGYRFSQCGPALAFTYWGVAGLDGFANVRDFNNTLVTPLGFVDAGGGELQIGAQPFSYFFQNSREHRISRDESVNNFEINLMQFNMVQGGRLQVQGLVGFRYFRFEDHLVFGATAAGHEFGEIGGLDECFVDFRHTNNLYGLQIGATFNYMATQRLSFYLTPKIGIYGNQMIAHNQVYDGAGNFGLDERGYRNDVSMLGEINLGLNLAFTDTFSTYLGYRVVGVTGVALSDNQFLPLFVDDIAGNGELLLHGLMFGGAWNF